MDSEPLLREQPLAGITVLDFGQIYNGPYCGHLMAMAGARVIKVENPVGETLRNSHAWSGDGYLFKALNGNKETITLNIKQAEGQRLLKKLIRSVDVLIENFRPGTMAKYGIGSKVLTNINPRLVYAAGTGYGQNGPHADYVAMDITVQAMSGVVSITGQEGDPPLKSGPAICDMLGGVHLYGAITTALFRRERTGKGAVLDIAMQDAVIPTLCSAIGAYYKLGDNPPRTGNHHQARAIAPYNIYPTRDGHVAIICIRESHWRELASAMKRLELLEDDRFETMETRARNMDITDAVVQEWTQEHSTQEVFATCQNLGIPCSPVQTLSDVLHDPHLQQRGMLREVKGPDSRPMMLFGTPIQFEDTCPPDPAIARKLGQDNEAVYGELLGLTREEVEECRQTGVL